MDTRLKKANSVLYLKKKSNNLKTWCKLGLNKSLLIPGLAYGLPCVVLSRSDILSLEKFSKRAFRWITGTKDTTYLSQLKVLSLLPPIRYLQLKGILFVAKMSIETESNRSLPAGNEAFGGKSQIFQPSKTRTEKAGRAFTFRTSRTINKLNELVDFIRLMSFCSKSSGYTTMVAIQKGERQLKPLKSFFLETQTQWGWLVGITTSGGGGGGWYYYRWRGGHWSFIACG